MAGELTTTQATRLAELEVTIERGRQSFVEVGHALIEIRESKLYRERAETFEAYCQLRWEFTRRHAERLMQTADVMAELSVASEKSDQLVASVATESVAREVAKAPKGERAAVVKEATATAKRDKKTGKPKVTAKDVQRVVASRSPQPKPLAEPPMDSPFAPGDREPWRQYNERLNECIAMLDKPIEMMQAIADDASGNFGLFAYWYTATEYVKLFKNIRTTWENHRVAGWASETFKRKHGGRVFVYEFEAKQKGALAG
jgi:hypothetical protein